MDPVLGVIEDGGDDMRYGATEADLKKEDGVEDSTGREAISAFCQRQICLLWAEANLARAWVESLVGREYMARGNDDRPGQKRSYEGSRGGGPFNSTVSGRFHPPQKSNETMYWFRGGPLNPTHW